MVPRTRSGALHPCVLDTLGVGVFPPRCTSLPGCSQMEMGSPPPSPLHPQPHSANPNPTPPGTSLGDPPPHHEPSLTSAMKPHGSQHGWEQVAAGQRGGWESPPQPRGGTSASLLRGNHHLQGRGWQAEGRTGRKASRMVLRASCSQTHLSGCHVTPRPHTPPRFSRVEEEALAQPAGAPLPSPVPHQHHRPLPRCHTPSPEKTLLSPAARQAPFCLGGKALTAPSAAHPQTAAA